MEKVSAMKKVALFMMTKRVARPMKFAAFISIIISVAVMLAACQGAIGKQGEKGETGDPGTAGTAGTAGITPLQVKGNVPLVVISDGDAMAVGDPETVDLTAYFRGGVGELKFGEPTPATNPVSDDFTAELEGTTLTLTAVDDDDNNQLADYAINAFTIEVIDEEKSNITISVEARRNRAPGAPTASVAESTGTVGTSVPDEAPEEPPLCSAGTNTGNECFIALVFSDADIETGRDKLIFVGESADTAKVDVVRVDTDDDGMTANVVVRGIATTTDDDDDTDAAAQAVEIKVTATDADGETAEGTVHVNVDAAPAPKGTMPNRSIKMSTAAQILITDVSPFFTDPDGAEDPTLTYDDPVPTSSNESAAKVTIVSANQLSITTVAPGMTTITVTVKEPIGVPQQTATQSFTLTVSD